MISMEHNNKETSVSHAGSGVWFCRCVLTQKGPALLRALSVVVKGDFIIHELRVGTCHVLLDRS